MANLLTDFARTLAPLLNTDATTPLENEQHASEHAAAGADPVTVGAIVTGTKTTPTTSDKMVLLDAAESDAGKTSTLEQVIATVLQSLDASQEIAEDGACALLNTTSSVTLASSAAGDKTITTTSFRPGQIVHLRLLAAGGGKYVLPVAGGDLTFDAAGEAATIARNAANDGWLVMLLSGATVV